MKRTKQASQTIFLTPLIWVAMLSFAPVAEADVPAIIEQVPALVETAPVQTTGDSADDPAVWVHPTDPAQSLVIVNNKRGALESYDLRGRLVQRITDSVAFWGNVDTRRQVNVGGFSGNLVAVSHRGLQFYSVDPDSRHMVSVTEGSGAGTSGEGVCLYQDQATATTYAVVITIQGRLRQYEVTDDDGNGLLSKRLVRDIQVGSEAEGCVAHDDAASLYVSEEDVALWRYGAAPGSGTQRTVVGHVVANGGGLAPDIEGVTLAETAADGDFLLASAQRVDQPWASYFLAFRIEDDGSWTRYRAFRVVRGATADDCDRTDGIAAYAGNLGPDFPLGIFVCQDNDNATPGTGNQNVKFVPLASALPVLAEE